ncbi:hypothetical protein BKA63DRAFT_485823 [Paraphoma chrysanthemicola]|nr:hypothetical protein BKA63DRAFT_485823 [Paraphoma chrysanthemicola]
MRLVVSDVTRGIRRSTQPSLERQASARLDIAIMLSRPGNFESLLRMRDGGVTREDGASLAERLFAMDSLPASSLEEGVVNLRRNTEAVAHRYQNTVGCSLSVATLVAAVLRYPACEVDDGDCWNTFSNKTYVRIQGDATVTLSHAQSGESLRTSKSGLTAALIREGVGSGNDENPCPPILLKFHESTPVDAKAYSDRRSDDNNQQPQCCSAMTSWHCVHHGAWTLLAAQTWRAV